MSYFLDDDEDGNAQLKCANCGGTSFYHDPHGIPTCNECFTQSQSQGVDVVDDEDYTESAAYLQTLLRGGRGIRQRKGDARKRIPPARKYPQLETCIEAFQYLMQIHTKAVAKLAGVPDDLLMKYSKAIWFGYLRAFTKGAQVFGGTGIRCSLRDCFMYANPAYLKRLEKEMQSRRDDSSSEDDEDGVGKDEFRFNRPYFHVLRLPKKGPVTPEEAALRLPLSMYFILCVLHCALLRMHAGVSAAHLVRWCARGKLPFFNAFDSLPSRLRAQLTCVYLFFRPKQFPRISIIENGSELVGIASQCYPRNIYGIMDNAPLLAARFVTDLGLDQTIFDKVLAIMGVGPSPTYGQTLPLPPPLPSAHISLLRTPVHVMAVIVMAIKMTPNWEFFTLEQQPTSHHSTPCNFIPWKRCELAHLKDPKNIRDYFDFLDDVVFRNPNVKNSFLSNENHLKESAAQEISNTNPTSNTNSPFHINSTLGGMRQDLSNPNESYAIPPTRSENWDQANGISKYVIYRKMFGETVVPAPFHPHYSLLIEFCASHLFHDPLSLHSVLQQMEQDIIHINEMQNKIPWVEENAEQWHINGKHTFRKRNTKKSHSQERARHEKSSKILQQINEEMEVISEEESQPSLSNNTPTHRAEEKEDQSHDIEENGNNKNRVGVSVIEIEPPNDEIGRHTFRKRNTKKMLSQRKARPNKSLKISEQISEEMEVISEKESQPSLSNSTPKHRAEKKEDGSRHSEENRNNRNSVGASVIEIERPHMQQSEEDSNNNIKDS